MIIQEAAMRLRVLFLKLLLPAFLVFVSACSGNGGSGGSETPEPIPSATSNNASALPQGSDPVELDSGDFVAVIDNPYWPITPGTQWVYRETDADGTELRVEVTVTNDTKTILGINATVVHDIVTENGALKEDTFDWYAQDTDGNVWYLGEDTKEYEDGEVVSTEGSWEHGVDGAQAGIVMPADPQAGMTYRQEYYAGEAEDRAKVLSLAEHVEVEYGTFDGTLQTEDTTPLDSGVLENKYYARGVGPVLAVDVAGGGREELIAFAAGQ